MARNPWRSRSRVLTAVVIGAVLGLMVGWLLVQLLLA